MAALLLAAFAGPAGAAFEQAPLSARATALGGAMTAVDDDPASMLDNPATLGPQRTPAAALDYLRQFDVPAGKANQDQINGLGVLPVDQDLIRGAFGFGYVYNQQSKFAVERQETVGFGTRNAFQFDEDALDFGGTIKVQGKSFDGGSGLAHGDLDGGMLYRFGDRYALGVSLLDVFRPAYREPGGLVERAPLTARAGFSERVDGFLLSMDLSQSERSGDYGAAATLAGGMERWWATERAGSFALRTGLSLGDRDKTWNWGLGWRMFGGELSYAMTVPMEGATVFGHCVSLSFRFGVSNPEEEYEKVLADQLRFRRELTSALEQSQVKQWQLSEQLDRLRDELKAVQTQLESKALSERKAKERISEIERQRAEAQRRFEDLRDENKKLAERSQQQMFQDDWNAYLKLKSNGAPDAVLIDRLRGILADYKDKGIDLSSANQELLGLLRTRGL